MENNYLEINREGWNARVEEHVTSDFYNMEGFLNGETSLNDIELPLLGEIAGKSILHLQCHFGQDSISMARMGANVTAIDLADEAIAKGKTIANQVGQDVSFISTDVYSVPEVVKDQFDIVFTSYGTIGWLPDINKWAQVVANKLKSGGRFIMAEFHPFIWMYDDEFTKIQYSYFKSDAIVESEGSYTENSTTNDQFISWNHAISEVITALQNAGLKLKTFQEHNFSPYPCFNKSIKVSERKYHIEPFGDKIPYVYALEFTKPS